MKQLELFNDNYALLVGKQVRSFVCPITLEDKDGELCDGHILNDGLKQASRKTIVQRKDVDNYFGHTLEPDLVKWLNAPTWTMEEVIGQAKSFTIKEPNGEKMQAFFAGPAARRRFQQLEMYRTDGSTLARPYLRDHQLQPKRYSKLEVEVRMAVTKSALTGAMLKCGYLAMFQLLRYSWALCPSANRVRSALAGFYLDRASKEDSLKYFREFTNCHSVAYPDATGGVKDTLEDGTLFLHYAEGNSANGILFAVTCLFLVNRGVLTVTLPFHDHDRHYFIAKDWYEAFLADRSRQHNVYLGRCADQFEIASKPMVLYCAAVPGDKSKQISPCSS